MHALISGQAEIAVLIQGNKLRPLYLEGEKFHDLLSDHAIPYLFAGATDLVELKGLSQEEVRSQLERSSRCDRSLQFFLILLDECEDATTRALAAECLEEILADYSTYSFLSNRMYMAPLPSNVSIHNVKSLIKDAFQVLRSLLEKLEKYQGHINSCRKAWEDLSSEMFADKEARQIFECALIEAGLFRQFAEAADDPDKFDEVRFYALKELGYLTNHREIIQEWSRSFRPKRAQTRVLSETLRGKVKELPEEERPFYKRVSGHDAFENVKKQKLAIVTLIQGGEREKALRYIEQLVASQLKNGGAEFAVKSLCDLAQEAKEVFDHLLQLELARRAVELVPTDGWACGQLGDAYFCLNRYNEAWDFFERASQNGERAFAQNGFARILKEQGKFDKALETYEAVISEFPEHVTSWCGRAEVLRDMWQLESALTAYEEAINRFPDQRVPRCGRAAVLKEMGRLDEALSMYQATIRELGDNPVPHAGQADVLMNMGRLEEALEAYERTIERFPREVVPRCGRAQVLKEMGRLEEALRAYEEIVIEFKQENIPLSGRAEVLKEMGRHEEALQAYEEAIEKFPLAVVPRCGRAAIFEKQGFLEEALQAYDQTIAQFPYEIVPWSGRAEILKELGKFEEALQAYDKIIQRNPNDKRVRHSRAAIFVVLGRYGEAEALLPVEQPHTLNEWVAYHIRGMMYLKQGNISAALEVFQNGVQHIPWANEKRYFKAALAVAKLHQNKFRDALIQITDTEPLAEVLKIHAFGGLGKRQDAKQVYGRLEVECPLNLIVLRDELGRRYAGAAGNPEHSEDWVFQEECRLILLRAA